jgi:hypothetical protein
MLPLPRGVLAWSVCATLIVAAPAAAVPITVTQTRTLNEVLPYGTFSDFIFDAASWSATPFPFTAASQISSI